MKISFAWRLLKKASLVFVAAFVGLFLIEVALRLSAPKYYPVNTAAYEYDAEIGYRLKPAAHLFSTTDFQHENRTNKLGTANFQESFDDYERLIFAVGDSYTQGTGLPADMTYPAQLDLMLNEDEQGFYAKRYGVVNLGVAGYGAEQSLVSLRKWTTLIPRSPSVILYLGCDNDFTDDLAFRSGDRHKNVIAGSPRWGWMTRPARLLLERTQIGHRLRAARLARRRGQLMAAASNQADASKSVAELQSDMLARIADFAREHNAMLVVSWSDDGKSYDALKKWAGEHDVRFADWLPRAASVRNAMPSLPLNNNHSGAHHRGWTNRIIAAEFARQVNAQKF